MVSQGYCGNQFSETSVTSSKSAFSLDEDTEQAYFEIGEYVRISALLCFSELATPPNSESLSADKKILH